MTLKTQRPIVFHNLCDCIVDYQILEKAILSYAQKPVQRNKKIFLHGKYPGVSIGQEKLHVHRLIGMYIYNELDQEKYIYHHKNGNRLDARVENIVPMQQTDHAILHNKGKGLSLATRLAIIERNKRRKGIRTTPKRPDVTKEMVYQMHSSGMSFNAISKAVSLDWDCVKQRYVDFLHDSPELLK